MDILIGIDSTDHLAFFCGQCKNVLKVTKVKTQRVIVAVASKQSDKCTWVHCVCPLHGEVGFRKFYWTTEDGDYTRESMTPND